MAQKTEQYNLRLTAEELAMLKTVSESAGITVTDYLLQQVRFDLAAQEFLDKGGWKSRDGIQKFEKVNKKYFDISWVTLAKMRIDS